MAIKKDMWPGILLTVALAVVAKLLVPWVPALGAEGLAIIMGLVIGNVIFTQPIWTSGVIWAEKYVIQFGIALLGLTVTLATVEKLGWQGVLFIMIQMTATILFVLWLGGRIFKVSKESALLMGAGNAVCGTSAIAAVAPVVGAKDEQRRTAAATVSLTGVVLLLLLPELGPHLFGHNDIVIGGLIGGTLQSVGQAVGAGTMVNPEVGTYATLFKMMRVILLTVVVLAYAQLGSGQQPQANSRRKFSLKGAVPWFVTTFVIFMLGNTFADLPTFITVPAKEGASFFGVVNLAGIGLSLKWQTIKSSGMKFMGYGLVTAVFQVIVAIILLTALF
jgi:uncharacterized integral membrane protein (TIGR00698 family)